MESYPLPHLSTTVHLALFTPLTDAAALRSRLIAASTLPQDAAGDADREAVNFAFVDAKMNVVLMKREDEKITSRMHILTAVTQALLAETEGAMRTKTVHSEVLWKLEPGSNITDSLKHFGLSPSTSSLLLVRISPFSASSSGSSATQRTTDAEDNAAVLRAMEAIVAGSPLVSLELLGKLSSEAEGGAVDEKSLRKYYKLNSEPALAAVKQGTRESIEVLDRLVSSAVALKTVA
ncbi:hypothetical protein JCM8547_001641 [Rhodosporidiobolus lusitaniae]